MYNLVEIMYLSRLWEKSLISFFKLYPSFHTSGVCAILAHFVMVFVVSSFHPTFTLLSSSFLKYSCI